MNMAFHKIPLIGLGLCLVVCLNLVVVQGRQPGPRPGDNQEYPIPRSTILSAMASELTSVYGNCSFPPNDVLTNRPTDSFDFLERCDSKIPHLDRPISDEGVITCLGLFEVGLRLCSLDEKYFKNEALLTIPKNSNTFNTLLDAVNKENAPDLCTDLKKVLGILGENEFSVLNNWNLLKIFKEAEGSCTRICFDYKNNARLMCKLILWGGNLLIQPEPKPFESTIANAAQTLQLNKSHEGLNQSKKTIAVSPTFGPEISAIDLEGGDEQVGLVLNRENAEVSIEREETETGARLESSPATISSFPMHKANDAEEGRPKTQAVPISVSMDDKPTETLSKSSGKKVSTKLVSIGENQAPYGIVSDELSKITDKLMESSRPSSKLGHDSFDFGASKSRPRTNTTSSKDGSNKPQDLSDDGVKKSTSPTSSIGGSEPKDITDDRAMKSRPLTNLTSSIDGSNPPDLLDEGVKKSGSIITNPSIDGSIPQDASADGNSAASPPEKTLPDISPRGDEFRDHYDSSMDQNLDIDDEGNMPPAEPESPVNQEPTGYKTDYKYPREELTNGNTFLQERFEDSEDSHFFSYFMAMIVLCIVGYVVFHNKQKILALALEGRSRRGSRRRPTTANYHKLDNNLEEAVSSPCSTSVTHVIY